MSPGNTVDLKVNSPEVKMIPIVDKILEASIVEVRLW